MANKAGMLNIGDLSPNNPNDAIELIMNGGEVSNATNTTSIFNVGALPSGVSSQLYIITSLYVTNISDDPIVGPGLILVRDSGGLGYTRTGFQDGESTTGDTHFMVGHSHWMSPGETMVYIDKTTPVYCENDNSAVKYKPTSRLQLYSTTANGEDVGPYSWALSYVRIRKD